VLQVAGAAAAGFHDVGKGASCSNVRFTGLVHVLDTVESNRSVIKRLWWLNVVAVPVSMEFDIAVNWKHRQHSQQ